MYKRLTTTLAAMILVCSVLLVGCTQSPTTNPPNDTPAEPAANTQSDKPVECDWTLNVNQTIPVTTDGMTVNYTLVLNATKKGGIDVIGDYIGSGKILVEMDASGLSNEVIKAIGGFKVDASADNINIPVVAYDRDKYANYNLEKDEVPIVPLVKHQAMALISPQMIGSGILNPTVTGIQGEKAEVNEEVTGNTSVPMKITINDGKVNVYIPSFKISKSFEGMLLGTPINK